MPLPDGLARFNRRVTNPVARRFAGRVPGTALVVNRGRKSGREYRTPVNAFRRADGFTIPATYGSDRDWVKNVLAAGGCTVVWHRREYPLVNARLVQDDNRFEAVPAPVRGILRLLGVEAAIRLDDEAA